MMLQVQAQIGFEQYCYVKDKQMSTLVPILNYESNSHWYGEARYNYEDVNTFSLYVGKTFSNDNKLHFAITPMVGGVVGKYRGISSALNAVVEFDNLFFSTQTQHTIAFHEKNADFLFSWSEFGYQPWKWFFFGVTAQQTYMTGTDSLESEPGLFIGVSSGMWTFPIYVFRPMTISNYFVLGISLSTDGVNRNK